MDRNGPYSLRTVEEVFSDYNGRRKGIIRALTVDDHEFYQQCDPEKDNLCLYGFPNEEWKVTLPAEEVPRELPEPALGINFARDGMQEKHWLSLVAVHSDSWLLSVAYYFGARYGFDKADREHLFNMINVLPTIFEIVSGAIKIQSKEKSSSATNKSRIKSKSKSNTKRVSEPSGGIKYPDLMKYLNNNEESEDEESEDAAVCGACDDRYAGYEFWICCDICEEWFHGKCVKISPAKAEHMKQYKCPWCSSNKRARLP